MSGLFFISYFLSGIVSRDTFGVVVSALKKYPITTEMIVINALPNLSESRTVRTQNVIVSISAMIPTNEK